MPYRSIPQKQNLQPISYMAKGLPCTASQPDHHYAAKMAECAQSEHTAVHVHLSAKAYPKPVQYKGLRHRPCRHHLLLQFKQAIRPRLFPQLLGLLPPVMEMIRLKESVMLLLPSHNPLHPMLVTAHVPRQLDHLLF